MVKVAVTRQAGFCQTEELRQNGWSEHGSVCRWSPVQPTKGRCCSGCTRGCGRWLRGTHPLAARPQLLFSIPFVVDCDIFSPVRARYSSKNRYRHRSSDVRFGGESSRGESGSNQHRWALFSVLSLVRALWSQEALDCLACGSAWRAVGPMSRRRHAGRLRQATRRGDSPADSWSGGTDSVRG